MGTVRIIVALSQISHWTLMHREFILFESTMTSPINKKQQEVVARKEIAKRRYLHDESESDSSSGSESDEGSDEAEPCGDNPPANNAEKGSDDESGDNDSAAEESNEQVEDSDPANTPEARSKRWFLQGCRDVYFAGLNLNEKGNPSCSIQEEQKIQINSLNEVLEHKRLFEGYNMYWIAKTSGKYDMEMVHEF
ncbi:hypothetical protein HAX54_013635 [Datura stramonium]|uniref:Uncharacterized protein n=1 Tax=Datura stramonium TaxID=4076 RepID=A0ABS8TN93_DATST|nr:hypothetical protein [Datura stramonium]